MDTKSIIVILVLIIIILTCGIIGLVIQSQQAQNVDSVVNNTTVNNTSLNTTVEQINSDPVQSESQSSDSDSQSSDSGMPEDVRKRYAARQKAAEDGIPMYEYAHSPELVEKYQSMV